MSVTEIKIEKTRTSVQGDKKCPKIPITTTLALDVLVELEAIGRDRDVRISQLLRLLALRGLAAYHRDGLLDEPLENLFEMVGD